MTTLRAANRGDRFSAGIATLLGLSFIFIVQKGVHEG
jgi:hypothetical protein